MSTDCDDVAALCAAHALADAGEAELVAVLHNTGLDTGVCAVGAINQYYGRADTPVGAYKGNFAAGERGLYVDDICRRFPVPAPLRNKSTAPAAVDVYRSALAAQPDGSVVVASIGFTTNLESLLRSPADAHSPLSGAELVRRKVRAAGWMGGEYPRSDGTHGEWNFAHMGDRTVINSTRATLRGWPAEARRVFSGWEIGSRITTGAVLTNGSTAANPCRAAFIDHQGPGVGRMSWDPATVLFSVRGAAPFWTLRETGRNVVAQNGTNAWLDDGAQHNQSYLVQSSPPTAVAAAIDALLLRPPAAQRAPARARGVAPGCSANITDGICIVGDAAQYVRAATTPGACCTACESDESCVAWHLKATQNVAALCVLKATATGTRAGNCSSGHRVGPAPPPAPPAPPAPPTPSPAPRPTPSPAGALAFDKMFLGGAVLQRDEYTPVWGAAGPGDAVTLARADGAAASAVANSSGIWTVLLPPHAAQYNVSMTVSTTAAAAGSASMGAAGSGATATATAVVSYGEVVLCVGQSNMGMQVGPSERGFDADNATAEAAAAFRYSGRIQLFESGGARSKNPAWFTVDPVSIRNFSAVCWLTGRDLFGSMGERVPVGLVLSAIGAHPIESWLGPAELAACGVSADAPCEAQMPLSKIWLNAIVPVAPFKIGFMIYDQAEADVDCRSLSDRQDRIAKYACLERALVTSYREMFNSSLGFAAVQLPGYSDVQREGIFTMRLQQRAGAQAADAPGTPAVAVPTYDLSCAMGKTDGCPHGNVHNVHKQPVGARLAAQIAHLHLGAPGTVLGPEMAGVSTRNVAGGFNVTVNFAGGSEPFALRPTRNCSVCCGDDAGADVGDFDASMDGNGTAWVNGTKPALVNGTAVRFFVAAPPGSSPQWVRYTANRAFPQCALYNQEGFPAFPFRARVAA
eukprot:g7763.t1